MIFRVVVGDDNGAITCFEVKKADTKTVFKLEGESGDRAIGSVSLGGTLGHKDKIFASSGLKIKGLTKKGREFFTFISNLTEDIKFVVIFRVSIACNFRKMKQGYIC